MQLIVIVMVCWMPTLLLGVIIVITSCRILQISRQDKFSKLIIVGHGAPLSQVV